MKCKYCGKQLVEGAKFCVYCGKPVEEETNIPIIDEPKEEIIPEPTEVNIAPENDIKIEEAPIESNVEVNVEPTPIELPNEEPKPIVEPAPVQPEVVPQPTIENKTEVVVKKNNPILLLIIIVLLIGILGVGGFYVYKNYIEKNNKETNNNTTIEEETTAQQIPEITKDDAKKLIDKYYYYSIASPENNLFTNNMTEKEKYNIALTNVSDKLTKIECSQISGFSTNSTGQCVKSNTSSNTAITTDGTAIDYDTLNEKYKYLFGKEKEISKENFKDVYYYFMSWEYLKDKNVFLQTSGIGGFEGYRPYINYFIQSVTINNDNLIVNVGYVYMTPKSDNNSENIIFETTMAGEKVTYKEEETKKDTFEKEFTDKYLDKLDTYTFTFKYEDDHYVFVDMKKA